MAYWLCGSSLPLLLNFTTLRGHRNRDRRWQVGLDMPGAIGMPELWTIHAKACLFSSKTQLDPTPRFCCTINTWRRETHHDRFTNHRWPK